ncbi:TPM domain-containing protein [Flagellimonas sp. GZD32]|uniref:TPM domain-containing protein n=1 Tax=Flagellimonas cixiensis TaxID=3228750 RepID=UPI0035C8CA71
MLKALWSSFLFLIFSVVYAQEEYPDLTHIVTDNARIFSEEQLVGLRSKLTQFESETTNQLVVLTIEELGNETIEGYANKTFNQNKLGQAGKDNGILVLFAESDREVRIEVGYGLEPYITDAVASRIIRNTMIPYFKDGLYFEGIDMATDQIISFLNDPEALEEFKEEIESEGDMPWWVILFVGFFLMMFVAAGGFIFYKSYAALLEMLRGIFIGKLGLLRGVFMMLFTLMPIAFSLVFMLLPVFFLMEILGLVSDYDALFMNAHWILYGLVFFFVVTILLAIIKIIRKGKENFKISFFKSDKKYMSKTFSKSGSHSFGSSSGSSSSSSFSGGGGSSGGGGASGSW